MMNHIPGFKSKTNERLETDHLDTRQGKKTGVGDRQAEAQLGKVRQEPD